MMQVLEAADARPVRNWALVNLTGAPAHSMREFAAITCALPKNASVPAADPAVAPTNNDTVGVVAPVLTTRM